MEESEHFDVFSEDDQRELLFRIFKHVMVGGALCQFEDYIMDYKSVTKFLYKNLVVARKR